MNKIKTFLTWQWVKTFLYWLVVSAGTVSECSFLIAGIWISVNARVHPFVLQFITEKQAQSFTYLALVTFTALPEIIMPLAIVTTLGHMRTGIVTKRVIPWVWATLFGVPTLLFIVLSAWTLSASSLSIGYEVPAFFSVASTIGAYIFSISALLYWKVGRKDYADYVNELKDECVRLNLFIIRLKDEYQVEKADLINVFTESNNELTTRLLQHEQTVIKLSERASSLASEGLNNYPLVVKEWLDNSLSTVTLEVIARDTGHTKRKIQAAKLRTSTRNKELYLVSSVVDWLRITPAPNKVTQIQDYLEA
jgi:hypothetical protein